MDRLMTPKEICETSISALCEHCTVRLTGKPESIPCGIYDNRAAAAKAQRDLTANHYETEVIPQKIKDAEIALLKYLIEDARHPPHDDSCRIYADQLEAMLKDKSRGIA